MSLAFDEYGRPFIIIKEGATKDEAFKETFGKLNLLKLDAAWKAYVRGL